MAIPEEERSRKSFNVDNSTEGQNLVAVTSNIPVSELSKYFGSRSLSSNDFLNLSSGYDIARGLGLSKGKSRKYSEHFTPFSEELKKLLEPGAFAPEQQFRTDILRNKTLGQLLSSKESLRPDNFAFSGQREKEINRLDTAYRNTMEGGQFDIEQDIMNKRQSAQQSFNDWMREIRNLALQLK